MCECCNGDCKLCGGYGHIDFPEPITKVVVREVVDKDGCRLEELIINDKWKMEEDSNLNPPYRYVRMKMQPLNEAYKNEILEAYQKISDTFDDFTQLMRKRVPYEQWPDHCKIAGVSEHLLGPASPDFGCTKPGEHIQVKIGATPKGIPIPDFQEELFKPSGDCAKDLEECIRLGWKYVQSDCRPDESFRAMLRVMIRWMAYLEAQKKKTECQDNIWDVMKARGLDPMKAFPIAAISRLEDFGRAQERLKNILDEDIFHKSAFDPLWTSENPEFDQKLDDLRVKISCLEDNLWDLMAILRKEGEE